MPWNSKTGRWELDTNLQGLTPQQKALMESYNSGDTGTYRSAIDSSELTNSSPVSKIGGWSGEDFTATPGGLSALAVGDEGSGKSFWGEASDWFGNKGNQAMLQTGFGAANLGLGLASYLQQSDISKKQGKLLDQQLASNQYEMDRRQGFSNAMAANARSAG